MQNPGKKKVVLKLVWTRNYYIFVLCWGWGYWGLEIDRGDVRDMGQMKETSKNRQKLVT